MKWILLISVILASILLTGCAVSPESRPFPPPEGYSSWEEYQKEFDKKANMSPVQVTPTPSEPPVPETTESSTDSLEATSENQDSTVTPPVEDSSTQSPQKEDEVSRDKDNIPSDDDTGSPIVSIDAQCPSPTGDNTPNFSGTAINTDSNIISVEYRIDTEAWKMAEAIDGTFDEFIENYNFTTPSLADGEHTIEARASDAVGNITTSYAQTNIIVDTTPPTVPSGVVKASPDSAITPTFAWDAAADVTSSVGYYEVRLAEKDEESGAVFLSEARLPTDNPRVDINAIVSLLWRDEALDILEEIGKSKLVNTV